MRFKLHISGIVQGVGFRPFIYKTALKHSLHGYVHNDGTGVVVEIEGDSKHIKNFRDDLESKRPALSRVDFIKSTQLKPLGYKEFTIVKSDSNELSTMLSPDISLCDECRAEMNNKENRRYRYPFINCTNCGPRYTIIKNLPYDRDKTSMSNFPICVECEKEYKNPLDRRYHAQPISCFNCGPKISLLCLDGTSEINETKAIKKICELIKNGESVGIKGLGGFHIVCDATNANAVKQLRLNKYRPTKPLAIMFKNITTIKKVCSLTKKDEELILSHERPIVIVSQKETSNLAKEIAPNIDKIGVFLPYTPLHELLLKELNIPIVATSANLSDEPIIRDAKELLQKMPLVLQYVLTHDREILNACDDSVVESLGDEKIMLRLARGYAPQSLYMKKTISKKILALGAHQKSTITLAFDNNIVISPHIGDLNSIESFEYFSRTLETLKRVYQFEPDVIVCDKHPKYKTTLWAKEYTLKHKNIELIQLQHHYAHTLSCMAEHSLNEDVLAFSFDGTGYGDDGNIWGGEVFVANLQNYKRVYHFKELPLLGGDKAVREPRRVGLSLLYVCFTLDEILQMDCDIVKSYTLDEIKMFHQMFKRQINTPKTSSLGRLFDGVYALSGHMQNLGYEGESGLILEAISKNSSSTTTYNYTLKDGVIGYKDMIYQILQERDKEIIAKKFISTISKIIVEISNEYPELPVVLSGGVFQNKILVMQVTKELTKLNRKYYMQSKTPINDGGISLGQAYFAIHKKDK